MADWFISLRYWRYRVSAIVDALLWYPTIVLATLARLNFEWDRLDLSELTVVASIAAATQLIAGLATGVYRGHRTIASFGEVMLVVVSSAAAGTAALVLVVLTGPPNLAPVSAVLAATAYQMLGALGLRYAARLLVELRSRSHHERSERLLVFGAGDAGEQIVRSLLRDTATDLDPIGLLDDDPTKQRLRFQGIQVLGTSSDIAAVADRMNAGVLLIALPSGSQRQIGRIADAAQDAGLAVKVLPSVTELAEGTVRVGDIRDIELADFLNRDEVTIDFESVHRYIAGKRVLVTGAGGSIGSQLCRTITQFDPDRLIMLDHDENALHALQLSLEGQALLTSDDLVLCDIRDAAAIQTAFETMHPEVVFHAAAHKHVTFLERFPSEGNKTNVEGTRNVVGAALSTETETFVNISTDKAADPINVLGRTKREAELITAATNRVAEGRFLSVRFGNVLGSNGSVIPTFVEQLEAGEPLTVTDRDATRYFMTVDEAVLLVLQAGALAEGGDVLVLDMGEPVSINNLAIRLSRRLDPHHEPDIVYTGLRPGEKLHEQLVSGDDEPLSQPHPRLQRFRVVDPTEIDLPASI